MPNRQLSLSAASAVICFVVFMIIDTLLGGIANGNGSSVIPAISASVAVGLVTYFLSAKKSSD